MLPVTYLMSPSSLIFKCLIILTMFNSFSILSVPYVYNLCSLGLNFLKHLMFFSIPNVFFGSLTFFGILNVYFWILNVVLESIITPHTPPAGKHPSLTGSLQDTSPRCHWVAFISYLLLLARAGRARPSSSSHTDIGATVSSRYHKVPPPYRLPRGQRRKRPRDRTQVESQSKS